MHQRQAWKVLTPVLLQIATAQQVTDLSTYSWTLQNEVGNISIPARIPSYAHLDLQANNVVGQLEYGLNDFDLRWIWMQNWTYSTVLSDLSSSAAQTYLLFQGLDTFTSIELCGQHVASTNNQFRQYYLDVSDILSDCNESPLLSINFGSAPQIAEDIANEPGQEMWPYGTEIPGPAYAPAGPWQPAYAVQLGQSQVHPRNVLVDIYKQGQRNNLIPDQDQPWVMNASIDVLGTLPDGASLSYTVKDASNGTVVSGNLADVNQTDSVVTGSITIPKDSVDLWWPVGMGPQTLYYVTIDVMSASNQAIASVTRRVGFRTIVLNETPVTDDQIALGIAPGNNWHFEINGHPFYAKGSNFIPPDVFWPRVNASTTRTLLNSVVAGNQNMLRVWSSGAYSPDFMYDIADELGILLWSEFEFGDALYPVNPEFLSNVYEEAVYQVRRVNHHPSLAYWAGGNELENLELPTANESDPERFPQLLAEYEQLFLTTLFPAVFENTRSISYAPSSTSNGFISLNFTDPPYFQERYDNTTGGIYGETDYYNYDSSVAFNTSAYPVGRFSNEFGYHSMPSLQTWRQYIPDDQLSFNSTHVIYRNRHYPPGSLNTTNYANTSKGMGEMTLAAQRWYPTPHKSDSIANFSAWCWTTQVFQAEYYGSQIQFYRRGSGLPQRTLGSLYWQLEDQWAAPTWAGIEVDGRWKVLHYRARDLYQNVIVSPFFDESTRELEVWVTSDLWEGVSGAVDATWYFWNGTEVTNVKGLHGQEVSVGALNSTRVWSVDLGEELAGYDMEDIVLRMSVSATGRRPNNEEKTPFTHTNWFHASRLSEANLVDPGLEISHDQDGQTFTVSAKSGVSAFTWIDYPAGVVVTFDDNGFWLGKGESKRLGYNVTGDTTGGAWVQGVTVQSLWNNTLDD
ncbi:hypothetical protein OHC33_005010 [Knufia fluminis]|uniref:Beta-mannosidase A n=1 Tax=Knufia fluminis TaxID=191047 RepID=A0AAN8F984_9EURO|nr:hypothetical protein OHC33_005010 [Knufia fluminis]